MLKFLTDFIVGSRNQRIVRRLMRRVAEINRIYESYKHFKDEDFLKKTEEFLKRLRDSEKPESILPEAFALVKARAYTLLGTKYFVRGMPYTWDMVHYDVQLAGGIVLFQGKIAEMKTGEGKTLVATLPLYLHALVGKVRAERGEKQVGVHLITVNDYLAARDREWMRPVYEGLGLTVGLITMPADLEDALRRGAERDAVSAIRKLSLPKDVEERFIGMVAAGVDPETFRREFKRWGYSCDIVYGTNNEFGFDYLRDHMVMFPEDRVQRGHYYGIVDEVDNVLIDEARTPLIISGPAEHSRVEQYVEARPIVEAMVREQNKLVAKFLDEAEKLLAEGKTEKAGFRLLQVKRGAPKNKRLFRILQEPGMMKLVDKAELKAMKDQGKLMRELDAELFFTIDEKTHTVDITEKGRQFLSKKYPDVFTLPDLAVELPKIDKMKDLTPAQRMELREKLFEEYAYKTDRVHAIQQLLKAYMLYEREVDYVVMNGEVIIVDEFTGRLMPGRRWSDGLHEAVEAKERVKVKEETQTLATITVQNYFRLYEILAGMTGTAMTEAQEFWDIYKLDVVAIPTNKPVRRIDYPDIIFKTKKEKFKVVVDEIEKWHKRGRPILVGTTSIDESELLSRLLKARGVPHQVLNARHHEREALIVARAGNPGSVTIATNMAGRGTDIKLGKGVVKAYELVLKPIAKEIAQRAKAEELVLVPEERLVVEYMRDYLKEEGVPFAVVERDMWVERSTGVEHDLLRLELSDGKRVEIDLKAEGPEEIARKLRPEGVRVWLLGRNIILKVVEPYLKGAKVEEIRKPECAINTKPGTVDPRYVCPVNPKECIKNFVPCGLLIIGTQRHESRRIDNQLRGRAGRQGDPGASKFFLSLEDDLLRLFGSDKVVELSERFGRKKKKNEPIESKMVTKALENAQKRVEYHYFQIRKRLLEYDDVMNKQREVVYALRDQILEGADLREMILEEYIPELVWDKLRQRVLSPENPKEEEKRAFADELAWYFMGDFSFVMDLKDPEEMAQRAIEHAKRLYQERERMLGPERMRRLERWILLQNLDRFWRYHLYTLDQLKEGMYLRSYANKDPLVEYKRESFALFDQMMAEVRDETIKRLFREREVPERRPAPRPFTARKPQLAAAGAGQPSSKPAVKAPRGVKVIKAQKPGVKAPRGVQIVKQKEEGKK